MEELQRPRVSLWQARGFSPAVLTAGLSPRKLVSCPHGPGWMRGVQVWAPWLGSALRLLAGAGQTVGQCFLHEPLGLLGSEERAGCLFVVGFGSLHPSL